MKTKAMSMANIASDTANLRLVEPVHLSLVAKAKSVAILIWNAFLRDWERGAQIHQRVEARKQEELLRRMKNGFPDRHF